jgi:hypothetical protein
MNRRNCFNCQSSWYSLADHELESPHTCPRCGDQLAPLGQGQPDTDPVGAARTQPRS